MIFASIFGIFLFTLNFVQIFDGAKDMSDWIYVPIFMVGAVYISFIIITIKEPLSPLRRITKEELEDHEYDRIEIDAGTSTLESDDMSQHSSK